MLDVNISVVLAMTRNRETALCTLMSETNDHDDDDDRKEIWEETVSVIGYSAPPHFPTKFPLLVGGRFVLHLRGYSIK